MKSTLGQTPQIKKVGYYSFNTENQLGKGAQGAVLKGLNTQTNQQVAIKIIPKTQIKTQYQKNAIEQQIKILMKLNSPNIVKFKDFFQTSSSIYIVMGLANQGNLRDVLRKQKRLDEKQTTYYIAQILNGFGEMFKFGIIHRDIKPQNILVDNKKLKIGDFGLSKRNFKSGSTMMQSQLGTPTYMAPQILAELPYTYKCDIWSLGVMTYEMIVGELPFPINPGKSLTANFKIIKQSKINFSKAKISPQMIDFITGCLQFQQKDRFNWKDVFLHKIFQGIFQKTFNGLKKNATTVAYIMGSLRSILYEYNFNIDQQITKMPKIKLQIKDFKQFLQFLNCNILNEEAQVIIDILQRQDIIDLSQFSILLTKYQSKVQNLIPNTQANQKVRKFLLIKRLIQKINSVKEIDSRSIVIQCGFKQRKTVSGKQFALLFKKIAPQIPSHFVQQYFQQTFKISVDKQISLDQFHQLISELGIENMKQE